MDTEISKLCYEGQGDAVVALVSRQPSAVSEKDSSGRLAIHWSASGGHWNICDFLVSKGSPYDAADDSGWTPLMIAVSAGREDIVG